MTMIRRRTVLAGGRAVDLLVAGFAGGMAAERICLRVEHATEAAR